MMKYFLYGMVVFFGFNITASGGAMRANSVFDEMEKQCEAKFGVSKVKVAGDNEGVVADWTRPDNWGIFEKKNGWQLDGPMSSSEESEVIYSHYLKKGEERISIELYVSSGGNKRTLDRFVKKMIYRTSTIIPYKKAEGLGDLYVNLLYPHSRSLVWIYHNICFEINHEHIDKAVAGHLDTFALAKWIQQYAEKHLVNNMQAYYPKISRVDISQSKIYVGDTFVIRVAMDGNKEENSYYMEREISENLDGLSEDGLTLHLKALKRGVGEITFWITDRKTLLMTKKTVTINVLEKGKE